MAAPLNVKDSIDVNPQYKWVYNIPKILELQNIEYSYFKSKEHSHDITVINLDNFSDKIFINFDPTDYKEYNLVVNKSVIKWSDNVLDGDSELKIASFLRLNMPKYQGMLQIKMKNKFIISINLFFDFKAKGIEKEVNYFYTYKKWR